MTTEKHKAALVALRDHVNKHVTQWDDATNGSHHHPIWVTVAEALTSQAEAQTVGEDDIVGVTDDITEALIGFDELCNVPRERVREMCAAVLSSATAPKLLKVLDGTASDRIETELKDADGIPEMTNPLGKHWTQPGRDSIEIRGKTAYMDQKAFNALAEYSSSIPSGTYEGKMWKRKLENRWLLCWYAPDADPKFLAIKTRKISIRAAAEGK